MFEKKVGHLITKKESIPSGKGTNAFVAAATKKATKVKEKKAQTLSGNGALKFSTTGNDFVDQFGKASMYKAPRTFAEVANDMMVLWNDNPFKAMCFIFYLRIVTRVVSLFNGVKTSTPQRGQGLKHEGIFRMMWVAINHPSAFWKNISLYISVGSWKDIITMLSYDLQYNGWKGRQLDWEKMGTLILAGLENPNQVNLIKKYLPQIKANSQCRTLEAQADNIIAKWVCSLIFGAKESPAQYRKYRKLKTSGTAHDWQKLISQGKLKDIDFSTVHGRALSLIVSSKFLKNNGLEAKYEAWIAKQPVAKYTGYVYELMSKVQPSMKKYLVDTINKQFLGLVETAKKGINTSTTFIVVRDTSGSMSSNSAGTGKITCDTVAKSLALFFSYMLPDGHFANSWIEFNDDAIFHTWKGKTPVEKWQNDKACTYGGTNFQSVIKLFCDLKKKGIAESEFPNGILCISDGEFNPIALGKTNVMQARWSLRNAGFSKEFYEGFKIVLWNLANNYYGKNNSGNKFETYGGVENVFYFSGLDGSVVAFLTGMNKEEKAPTTAEELMDAAMNQEIMGLIQV